MRFTRRSEGEDYNVIEKLPNMTDYTHVKTRKLMA
jgi:hypothetical protein